MPTELPRSITKLNYYEAAQEYLRSLTFRNHMEARPQATQRKITLESLDLVAAQRADFHLFNEMLVQYPLPHSKKKRKIGQVVPDNMVVLHPGPIEADGSYDVPLQPASPYWVLEYVSPNNTRKDYEHNVHKYEQELRVPYYLIFAPPEQELTLFRHNGEKYVTVLPNDAGRFALPELELEVALLDRWVRYWYRGELLLLPAELNLQWQAAEAEVARLRAELDAMRKNVQE